MSMDLLSFARGPALKVAMGVFFVGEQDGVVGLHQDGIPQADHRDGGAVLGASIKYNVSRRVHVDEIGPRTIAGFVRLEVPRQSRP